MGSKFLATPTTSLSLLLRSSPNEIKFDSQHMTIFNIDIEVASDDGFPEPDEARQPVISIALKSNKEDNFIVWGLQPYDLHESLFDNVTYFQCEDEAQLLQKFLVYWYKNFPDIVTGWNIRFFDIPYLINRCMTVLGERVTKKFSPWELLSQEQVRYKLKEMNVYKITGVQTT